MEATNSFDIKTLLIVFGSLILIGVVIYGTLAIIDLA
jgi:hypothetical protein